MNNTLCRALGQAIANAHDDPTAAGLAFLATGLAIAEQDIIKTVRERHFHRLTPEQFRRLQSATAIAKANARALLQELIDSHDCEEEAPETHHDPRPEAPGAARRSLALGPIQPLQGRN